ncbi:MAG: phosphopantetheine-binding protein [Treponema sp.]|nr:phosphopantetheine-binding protein [Treponema sp.]
MGSLKQEIKELIISSFELEDISAEDIDDFAPLFGSGLGLDSIDALELGIVLKKRYGVKFSAESDQNKQYFASVQAITEYIARETGRAEG